MSTIQDAIRAWEKKDYAQARLLCQELATSELHARYLLGSMLAFGLGADKDPQAAAEQFRLAASGGYPPAAFALGSLYAQGVGVQQDFAAALQLYLQAARQGDPDAMYLSGAMFANGEGTALNPGLAAYWFFKAWQAGVDEAEQEIIRIRNSLEEAATAGSAEAQNALGLILCFGHDEAAAAAEWFHLAAHHKHPEATRMLGYLYHEGLGLKRDLAQARHYYEVSAELGDHFAQFNLAVMIEQGEDGSPPDQAEAMKWFRRAAEAGIQVVR